MSKRKVVLTEFNIQVLADDTIVWDGLDRFLWELLHGGVSVRDLAIRFNRSKWRQARLVKKS